MAAVRSLARLFVKVDGPRFIVPRGAKKIAARVARDFTTFIEGVTIGFNEEKGTTLSPAEGLLMLLDANADPATLFDTYRPMLESTRTHVILREWQSQPGFNEGWKWMTPDFARWFLWHVLDKPYRIDEFHSFDGAPLLKKVLIEHRRGEKWLCDFITAFRAFLYPGHGEDAETKAEDSTVSPRSRLETQA